MDATGVTGKVVAWGFIFDNYVLTLHKHVCSTANSFFKYALDDFNRGVVMMGGGRGGAGLPLTQVYLYGLLIIPLPHHEHRHLWQVPTIKCE